jgi:uncharacterized protein (DUF1501 family)
MKRRDFLKRSLLASTALTLPGFLHGSVVEDAEQSLVVIQLSGGNDALNMIVPYGDDIYHQLRPGLAIQKSNLHPLDEHCGIHGSMNGLYQLYRNGEAAVINSVGYPDPDRSHFRAMDIWQTGSGANEYEMTGWIGRYLDQDKNRKAIHAIEIDDLLSMALKGKNKSGLAVRNPERHFKNVGSGFYSDIANSHHLLHQHQQSAYLYKTLAETVQSADYIYQKSRIYSSSVDYPQSALGKNLKTIAELICSGSETKIYYTSLSGFDTHIQQLPRHEQVLKVLDEALQAFTGELKKQRKFNDVLILVFSEFGRRVRQNASGGTDHGKAGTVLLCSGNLKQTGLINGLPDLSKMDDGDVQFTVDFRNIYATILKKWLSADTQNIFSAKTELMNFI